MSKQYIFESGFGWGIGIGIAIACIALAAGYADAQSGRNRVELIKVCAENGYAIHYDEYDNPVGCK